MRSTLDVRPRTWGGGGMSSSLRIEKKGVFDRRFVSGVDGFVESEPDEDEWTSLGMM